MITVIFATNRDLKGDPEKPDFGREFQRDEPAALRFGWAEVSDKLGGYKINVVSERLRGRGQKRRGAEVFNPSIKTSRLK